jgi:hypothetical protein
MGQPMASRLLAAGHPVVAYDIQGQALSAIKVKGAETAASPAEVASRAEIVMASLPMPAIVQEIALGEGGVAYVLSADTEPPAILFVVKARVADLPFAPPSKPQSTTGGQAIAAWQSGPLVYVLVIQGDQQRYRALINSSAPPLA